ncbi:restriction endonuclease subunit S [Alloalcanivorax marinus]|uniref:restriction endonuclease subunit S n=1 Tax=Alloalcanivorax marinus TaxID=1177169 RepID=UPI00193424C9|nr:restriction endonuclease subunit S [Alloalcanivorax marinus]MBL7250078.1 restriction endonuclease subunit S [Alloalcanivorax marinus]
MNAPSVSIGEVAVVNPRFEKADRPAPGDPVSFVPMAAVSEKTVSIVEANDRPYAEVAKGYTAFKRGDVLIAKITPCFENGKMALADNLPRDLGFGSTEFHVIRASEKVDTRYLFNLLRNPYVRRAGEMKMKGAAGQRRVPAEFFSGLKIPLPPLEEQKRIAKILDAADALRAKRRECLAQLDALLQSTFLDFFGDPIANPFGWKMGLVGDLLEAANYGTSKKANESSGRYPILRMGNITYEGGWDMSSIKYIDLESNEEEKYLVKKGDILFNRTNSKELVGKTAVYRFDEPMAFAGYLVRARASGEADPEYIAAFMNSPQTKSRLVSMCKSIVGMANINAKEFQAIPIPVPPLNLQNRFSAIVDSVLRQKSKVNDCLEELDVLFHSLQEKAFSGEL